MTHEAVIWTEGKTDAQHVGRAHEILKPDVKIHFQPVNADMGDDQLLKQCRALAMVPQERPTIFMFDRDNPEILPKIHDDMIGYKDWGNNVFSFAVPVPEHRRQQPAVCIELYYFDDDLLKTDDNGRRVFLSSEFNPASGRHNTEQALSVGNRSKLAAGRSNAIRILDSEVFDADHKNVALSKADFASKVAEGHSSFHNINFTAFHQIFEQIRDIVLSHERTVDLLFEGFQSFRERYASCEIPLQIAMATDAAIQITKLATMIFCASAVRFIEPQFLDRHEISYKKTRPLRETLIEHFSTPSLSILVRLTRQCFHLIGDEAPQELRDMRAIMTTNPLLGPLGDLLDDLERVIPPDTRHGRTVTKRALKKPIMEYVLPELAKYEGRGSEISAAADDVLGDANPTVWLDAVLMLIELFAGLRALVFRSGKIDRIDVDSDQFVVLLNTLEDGHESTEKVEQEYTDLTANRLETYELALSNEGERRWYDIFPFLIIHSRMIYFYTRTRAHGYEYRPVFGSSTQLTPTKRKFSQVVLEAATALDRQMLFWATVPPATSACGVRGNIPAHDPVKFVGRNHQLAEIMDEIISIPNQNGLIHGPGGVGKTALLIVLSRELFEKGMPEHAAFKNIIWVSAKRDYYDPTLDFVESGTQQFRTLDHIWNAILEFHEVEGVEEYGRDERRWFVLELLSEEKTLLVLDNFETVSKSAQDEIVRFFGVEVKRYLRDRPDIFKVILTSREVVPSGFHQYKLSGLDKRESKLLMQRLDQPYQQSGQVMLTQPQRDQVYEVTRGIPLIIKHCYGQIFEYSRRLEEVLGGLASAGNKVVEFSFKEIFDLVERDDINRKILVLLEIMNKPLLVRQIADILANEEEVIDASVRQLLAFQCLVKVPAEVDDKYAINPDLRLLATSLVQRSGALAIEIKNAIARLPAEKHIDFSSQELEISVLFQEYLAKGDFVEAEDFIKEKLRDRPNSILLNLHYARFLSEQKRAAADAIARLERIRQASSNHPHVLRLLMNYNARLDVPNFEQASLYAKRLQEGGLWDDEVKLDAAELYIQWGTSIKLKFDLDPIKEMLRKQRYKELADESVAILKTCEAQKPHRWNYLMAQCHFLKWEYDLAKRQLDRAILALPSESYLKDSYERLGTEIMKKWAFYKRRER
jgi:hypothetical protein